MSKKRDAKILICIILFIATLIALKYYNIIG